jgi:hypothetical protein
MKDKKLRKFLGIGKVDKYGGVVLDVKKNSCFNPTGYLGERETALKSATCRLDELQEQVAALAKHLGLEWDEKNTFARDVLRATYHKYSEKEWIKIKKD